MVDPKAYDFCSEFYVIEKVVEAVVQLGGQARRIRIEALHELSNGKYSTCAYIEEDFTIQRTHPQTGGTFVQPPQNEGIWTRYDLPWTNRTSADGALQQALGFLRQRCD